MEEEHRTQGSTSVDGADPVTASGDDVTGSETEFVTEDEAEHEDSVTSVTEDEAEHEDSVTSVTEDEAEHEDSVTSVTEDEAEHENPVTSVTNEKPDTRVVRLNVTDIERIMVRGYDGEKSAMVVHRLLDELDELRSGAETEIIPGQQSFSIKDAMGSLKDVCDDEAVRLKFAAKLLEEQSKATNSRLEREHNAEQKRLDRADKDKDRDLKEKLASSRAEHDKDMTMIKKGMVRKEDLEDIVFLGQKSKPADRLKNQKELAARQAAHEEDETGNLDPPGEDPAYD